MYLINVRTANNFASYVGITLSMLVKKMLTFFSRKYALTLCANLSPEETICMKCQSLFSEKNKKQMTDLSSTEFLRRQLVLNVKAYFLRKMRKSVTFVSQVCRLLNLPIEW